VVFALPRGRIAAISRAEPKYGAGDALLVRVQRLVDQLAELDEVGKAGAHKRF